MKTWKLLLMALFASMFALSSCSDDEEDVTDALEPVITLSAGSSQQIDFPSLTSATKNITFNVMVQADGKLANFVINQKKMLGDEIIETTPITASGYADLTEFTYPFNMNFTSEHFIGIDRIVYEFVATDKQGQVGDESFTVTSKAYGSPAIDFGDQKDEVSYNFEAQQQYTLAFALQLNAPGKIYAFSLQKREISQLGSEGAFEDVSVGTGFEGQTAFTYQFSQEFTQVAFSGLSKMEFVFTLVDWTGKQIKDTLEVKRILKFETVKNGYMYHILAPETGAWDLDEDKARSASEQYTYKSMVNDDAGGSFTGKWKATIPVKNGNGTQFVKANSYDYEGATVYEAHQAYTAGTPSTVVSAPAVNDIYIARRENTYYVIKITNIDATAGSSTLGNKGKIEFEYKK